MSNTFWSGGELAYLIGLKEHYEPRLAELRARLDGCTHNAQREAIEAEILSVEQEYQSRRDATGQLLF